MFDAYAQGHGCLCLFGMVGVFAPTVPRPPWAVRYAYARGTAGAIFFLSPPTFPCAPEREYYNTDRTGLTELFTFTIQDAHHANRPLILPSLLSVAHELMEEPNRLSCGGSCRREHDCHHAHIDNVQEHHRHVTARHSHRLMLHYSPRFWMCWAG